jgi:hypothetical protein
MFRNQDRLFKDTNLGSNPSRTILWNGETTHEEIQKFLNATVPEHTRWESFQELSSKIKYRDDLIFALQSCLAEIQNERDYLRHKYETKNKE